MATATAPSGRWLFGPAPDLLLGCGLLYVALFAVFVSAGDLWVSAVPGWVSPLCVLLFSLPHYGATLVRVYEHRSDRRAYAVFTVWITLALVAALVAGVYQPLVGSLLLTLYLSWSPWHYTGQNYGLAVMFLRRQGIEIDGAPKRWLYASFVLSFAVTLAVIHESATWASARSLPQAGPVVHFMALGVPGAAWLIPTLVAAWLLCSGVALGWLARRAGVGVVPVAALMLTQSLWFAVPAVGLHWGLFQGVGPLDAGSLAVFLVWIAVGHSVQYLWVTSYYARAASDWRGLPGWLARTAAAGALVWTLPLILLAARPFGAASYETGLAFVLASVVNLHHFILDGAIWKLRDGRIARVLIASGTAEPEDAPPTRGLRTVVWAGAGVCALAAVLVFVHESWLLPRAQASGDLQATSRVLDRLAWVGRDPSWVRSELGAAYARERDWPAALGQYRRSVALRPLASSWGQVAMMHAHLGDEEASRLAQDHALALEPGNAKLFDWAALLSERLGDEGRAAELRARRSRVPTEGEASEPVRGRAAIY